MKQDKPVARGEVRSDKKIGRDANRDPITGAPGSHPVGTGLGAAAGGIAAGAAIGTVAGPVGTAVGAAVGAVVGGLAGKGVAERIDPTAEDAYWRDNHVGRSYVPEGSTWEDYQPAYRYGVDAFSARHAVGSGLGFDEVEPELATGWERSRGTSPLAWDQARHAARDSWARVSESVSRDRDADGREFK